MSAAMPSAAVGAGLRVPSHGAKAARHRVVARRLVRGASASASASSDAPADIIGNTDDDDDATCSLRARDDTAAKFRFEGTRRLYGDRRFDRLARAHVAVRPRAQSASPPRC